MKQSIFLGAITWLAAAGCGSLLGQTLVDLRTQSKTVDFRTAQSTKPVKSGTTLPPTCVEAEMFFLTSAAAGMNLYACPSANTWVLESGGGNGIPGGSDTQCQFNDAGVFGGHSGCTYNKATKVLTATGGFQSGDGTKSSGISLPELAVNGSNNFAIYGADSQSENGCIILSGSPSTSGDVLAYTGTTASTTESVPRVCKVMQWVAQSVGITATASIDFAAIGNGACGVNVFAAVGATTGARIASGYPADLASGLIGRMVVSAADTISVQLCNFSGASVDPDPGTYSVTLF
jgi:hypothetical protein